MTAQGMYEAFPIERIVYGRPAAAALATEAERIGAQRVFLLVSRTLRQETDWVAQMQTALGARFAATYDGMPAHTPREAVLDATAAARAAGADLVVTFGGGSVTDAGKMVRLALQHNIRTVAGFDPFVVRVLPDGSRAEVTYDAPTVGQVAIPTTLSGGDFNRSAGCTDTRTALKEIYRHPRLVARSIILDPAVTVRTPQWLFLSTGIRALDHAVETVCSQFANARSYYDSLQAIRLLANALPRVMADPGDLDARLDAQNGVWLSMEHNRFAVPMGASHGIGHVLGGTAGVPHGYTSCIMLPFVMRYNEPVNADRQALVADALARPGVPVWQALHDLISGLGLPRSLSAVGVNEAQFGTIAQAALLDHYLHTNPRPIHGVDEILAILRMAA